MTVTATSENISPPDNSVSTTFKITVVDPPVVNPPTSPTGGTLALTQPTYACQTGDITFNSSGGDGTPITYNAPGVSRPSLTSRFGIVEPGLRNDPKPITITATQSGYTTSYTFDFGAYCTQYPLPVLIKPIPDVTLTIGQGLQIEVSQYFSRDPQSNFTFTATALPPGLQSFTIPALSEFYISGISTTATGVFTVTATVANSQIPPPNNSVSTTFKITVVDNPVVGGALTLLPPVYDCATGAITFRSTGGNGSPVEYRAMGITDWTTNPNQFVDTESRTANDVQPFMFTARQNGVTTIYFWNLKAACGRARQGVAERAAELSVSVLGNPVSDPVTVVIHGAEGQPLNLRLLDSRGRLVESRTVEQVGSAERQRFALPTSGPGLLLLQVSSGSRSQTVKIIKQ